MQAKSGRSEAKNSGKKRRKPFFRQIMCVVWNGQSAAPIITLIGWMEDEAVKEEVEWHEQLRAPLIPSHFYSQDTGFVIGNRERRLDGGFVCFFLLLTDFFFQLFHLLPYSRDESPPPNRSNKQQQQATK